MHILRSVVVFPPRAHCLYGSLLVWGCCWAASELRFRCYIHTASRGYSFILQICSFPCSVKATLAMVEQQQQENRIWLLRVCSCPLRGGIRIDNGMNANESHPLLYFRSNLSQSFSHCSLLLFSWIDFCGAFSRSGFSVQFVGRH